MIALGLEMASVVAAKYKDRIRCSQQHGVAVPGHWGGLTWSIC